jgi:hypothetical protein
MLPTSPLRDAWPSTGAFELSHHDVLSVADLARSALLGFLQGSNGEWSKRELAEWLVGPYRAAIQVTPCGTVRRRAKPPVGTSIEDGAVEGLLLRTRGRIIEFLDDRASWEKSGFARYAVETGLIVGIQDRASGIGYAPAAFESMRLVDRVLSLLLADYLARPNDYASLVVCDDCGHVSFSWAELHTYGCTPAPPISCVVKKRRATIAGVGT